MEPLFKNLLKNYLVICWKLLSDISTEMKVKLIIISSLFLHLQDNTEDKQQKR